jgi:hypothetical protein
MDVSHYTYTREGTKIRFDGSTYEGNWWDLRRWKDDDRIPDVIELTHRDVNGEEKFSFTSHGDEKKTFWSSKTYQMYKEPRKGRKFKLWLP